MNPKGGRITSQIPFTKGTQGVFSLLSSPSPNMCTDIHDMSVYSKSSDKRKTGKKKKGGKEEKTERKMERKEERKPYF